MDKIRFISDLHVDINMRYPLELEDKDVFTVICGDTAGATELGIEWIRKNVKRGIIVNGNHMPYWNARKEPDCCKTMAEFRTWLADEFPYDSDITYLDAEIGKVSKEVDGILFVGSCFYTNFKISEPTWNPTGDVGMNMRCSHSNMNDYMYGMTATSKTDTANVKMKPQDLANWFDNAYHMIDKVLTENEKMASPKPVVLATHYPLVADYLSHSTYIEQPFEIRTPISFNWASYASDMKSWLLSHPSVKVAASGHIHSVDKSYVAYDIDRSDGDSLLLVHNPRGYVLYRHDVNFKPDLFVDTTTWKLSD